VTRDVTHVVNNVVMAVKFNVGDKFSTFDELQRKLTEFSNSNFVQLWVRDARTIAAANKRTPKRAALVKAELQY